MIPINILSHPALTRNSDDIEKEFNKGTKDYHLHIYVPTLNCQLIKSFEPELWFNGWYEGKCDICN